MPQGLLHLHNISIATRQTVSNWQRSAKGALEFDPTLHSSRPAISTDLVLLAMWTHHTVCAMLSDNGR